MPNVDFKRTRLARRLAPALHLDSPDFSYRLLSQKALVDAQSDEILTINFMDTLRPELWCIEGLARHLAPRAGSHYGPELIEPAVNAHISHEGRQTAWALYVNVETSQESVDDAYFLKKVRDQLGFGSRQHIDVNILPGMQREITLRILSQDEDEQEDDGLPELFLSNGMNTVVVTALDPRIAAWLCFTLACNYIDRGHTLAGYAAPPAAQAIIARWDAFTFDDASIQKALGFLPDASHFQGMLQSQHFEVHHNAQTWRVTPPIFRFDIIHPIDIIEEYLVVTHYSEAKPTPLFTPLGMGSQTRRSAMEQRLIACMQAYGARQTIGLLLDSYDNVIGHMRHDTPGQLLRLENAVNKNREYLVDSSLPPLLRNAVHPSAPLPPTAFYLFTETARLGDDNVAHSHWRMGVLLVGSDHPFNNAHTLLDALCHHLRLPYTLKRSSSPAMIPGRQMQIIAHDAQIGQFGEIHPEVLTNWGLFYPASFIELDLDAIILTSN